MFRPVHLKVTKMGLTYVNQALNFKSQKDYKHNLRIVKEKFQEKIEQKITELNVWKERHKNA